MLVLEIEYEHIDNKLILIFLFLHLVCFSLMKLIEIVITSGVVFLLVLWQRGVRGVGNEGDKEKLLKKQSEQLL